MIRIFGWTTFKIPWFLPLRSMASIPSGSHLQLGDPLSGAQRVGSPGFYTVTRETTPMEAPRFRMVPKTQAELCPHFWDEKSRIQSEKVG